MLTFHRCVNYGSYWQARCLLEALQALGYDAELLDFHSCSATRAEMRVALRPTRPQSNRRGDVYLYKQKVAGFSDAIEGLPLSKPFELDHPEVLEPYDAVVVGSDEIWNLSHPWFAGIPAFFGVDLPAPKKIVYGGSFGNYSCWEGIGEPYTEFFRAFDEISVRDENSWWMLKNAIGLEPTMVVDPCLLSPPVVPEVMEAAAPYALLYGHNFSDAFARQVCDWASTRGIPLISVGYRNDWADVQKLDASPFEFARLVKGSAAVVTNFFHGCVFALFNEKPYVCEVSPYRSIKVRGLAEFLGGQNRLVEESSTGAEFDQLLDSPLEMALLERVQSERGQSFRFLTQALEHA